MAQSNSRITSVFQRRNAAGEMVFIPFVSAGDPDLATTQRVITDFAAAGADVIEVGFPYSDPIADGPVIQSSYTRALGNGLKTADIFTAVSQVSAKVSCPLVAMVSYAIIFRRGVNEFVRQAAQAGFAGLIVPDLPADEAGAFAEVAQSAQLDLIPLIAPTTPADRSSRILQTGESFVYCIAVAGTTGARHEISDDLEKMLVRLRQQTGRPLAVGFGISGPDQVRQLRGKAEGVIVGSALVKFLEHPQEENSRSEMIRLAQSIAAAAHEKTA